MFPPEPKKSKGPWSGFGYLILVVLVILFALFVLRPLGQALLAPFQEITNAFQRK